MGLLLLFLLALLPCRARGAGRGDWNAKQLLSDRQERKTAERVKRVLRSAANSTTSSYVLFDLDMGGSTNILWGMLQAAVIAKLLRRTLVLPPPSPWYLKDYGVGTESGLLDESEGKYKESTSMLRGPTTVSTFSDFFDTSESGLGGCSRSQIFSLIPSSAIRRICTRYIVCRVCKPRATSAFITLEQESGHFAAFQQHRMPVDEGAGHTT